MIQVYTCDYVPSMIPDFIDQHITVDEDEQGVESYIIEVKLQHPMTLLSTDIPALLKQFGIVNPVCIYTGKKPKF